MASLVIQKLFVFGHEVIVVRSENERFYDQAIHDFGVEPISWKDSTQINLLAHSVDKIIYQIGDNFDFHQGCIPWLEQLSGIVCLHDFYLGNLFYLWGQNNRPEAGSILKTWYNPEAGKQFFSYKTSETLIAGTHEKYPMTEWICSMAEGVITHSHWGIDRVLKACPGPVHVVPLAYDAPQARLVDNYSPVKDKLQILTIGNVNKNKRVESVIKAIGKNRELRKKAIYQLAGSITPETKSSLIKLAKKQKVNLIISGEVSDAILADSIKQADLISCCRWPVLEASSASTIEVLLYGKPTLVINAGFYNEIPDQYAIKINIENEIAEIQRAMEKLIENPAHFSALGQQAQDWAKQIFTSENYALKINDIILATTRTSVVTNAINSFNKIMFDWRTNSEIATNEYIIKPLAIFGDVCESR